MKAFREQSEAMDPTTMTQDEMEAQKVVERDEMRKVLMELHDTEQRMVQQDMNENLAHHAAIPLDSDGEEEPFEDVELP